MIEDIGVPREFSRTDRGHKISSVIQIIDSAQKIACDQLVPSVFDVTPEKQYSWKMITPAERFYIKGLELEKTNVGQLSAYQELARGYGVSTHKDMMGNTRANKARLKTPQEWAARSLGGEGFSGSYLRHI